jgi:hypothetical protein
MYFILGYEHNLKTLVALSHPFLAGTCQDAAALKDAYRGFLRAQQPLVPQGRWRGIDFASDPGRLERLRDLFGFGPATRRLDPRLALARVRRACKASYAKDEALGVLLSLTIDMIFTSGAAEAGSHSTTAAIGVICIDPGEAWSIHDVIEALVHEATHTMVLLDERRFLHYVDPEALADGRHSVLTAIKNNPGGLNVVLHSIIVAAELLELRDRLLGHPPIPNPHPPTPVLINNALEAIKSITKPELKCCFTSRGQELLGRATEMIVKYD